MHRGPDFPDGPGHPAVSWIPMLSSAIRGIGLRAHVEPCGQVPSLTNTPVMLYRVPLFQIRACLVRSLMVWVDTHAVLTADGGVQRSQRERIEKPRRVGKTYKSSGVC
jgi:hypothetical protein